MAHKRLLIITQSVDEHAGVLEFFVGWIRELAKECEYVEVITLGVGTFHLPANVRVHSLGKEQGTSKVIQAVRMLWLLMRLTPGVNGVFAHMSPLFALIAWPFTVLFRKRLLLWYLHRSLTLKLRLAVMLSDVVVTADVESLTLESPKIVSIGHGIDVGKFTTLRTGGVHEPLRILTVGRITPIKNLETLIEAVGKLRGREHSITATIAGAPMMSPDSAYAQSLKDLVAERGLQDIVHFSGYVSHPQLPALYTRSDIFVGLTPHGGIDKVLLEAMAAGCIILTSNTVMAKYLGQYADLLIFPHGNVQELSDRLEKLMRLSDAQRKELSDFLVQMVTQYHNIEHVALRIVELL